VSHAGYLRDHWTDDLGPLIALIRAWRVAGAEGAELTPREALAAAVAVDSPILEPGDREILALAIRQTLAPRTLTAAHLEPLRAAGFDDVAIHDVVHVACCFAYMNRLADALGVELEERKVAWARELFGDAALAAHQAWARGQEPSAT